LKEILDEEEQSFSKTLDRGEALFEKYTTKATNKTLAGADVWRLYDTYGFPVDLTRLMAEEKGFAINETEFESEQNKAKEKSRAGRVKSAGEAVALDVHALSELEKQLNVKPTDDKYKYGKHAADAHD
jgi:alanyl-tRNA synthetase